MIMPVSYTRSIVQAPELQSSGSTLLFLPLFRSEALWCPRVYGSDFLLEGAVDEAMACESHLLRELG
jgi:hypothetical protein